MLFSVLPEDVQRDLRQRAHMLRFANGQIIQQRGDRPDGFYLIESGSVAVGQFLASGDFRGVALLGKGDSWGELAMFASRPRVVDAIARTPSEVRHIRAGHFEEVLAARPDALRPMLGALSQQLQEVLDVVSSIRRGSARGRIAGMLLTLAADKPPPVPIAITQQELGELLGLTRASVNAALGEFQELGLVRRAYRSIELLDPEALELEALG